MNELSASGVIMITPHTGGPGWPAGASGRPTVIMITGQAGGEPGQSRLLRPDTHAGVTLW